MKEAVVEGTKPIGEVGEVDVTTDQDQFLTFIMADEEYGVDILSVQEIRGWDSATPLPNAPEYIKGVINLRGTIVPIIDLRMKFGIPSVEYGPLTVVVVLKVHSPDKERIMGIVVDAVSDVYSLSEEDMREAPDMGSQVNMDYVKGLSNVNGKMVILLDIDKLLTDDQITRIDESVDAIHTH